MLLDSGRGAIGLVLLMFPLMVSCGRDDGMPDHPLSPAVQLRKKLNSMSVPDRLAYIKKHREVIEAVAGGGGPKFGPQGKKPKAAP